MVITNYCAQAIVWALGSNIPINVGAVEVGYGSGAPAVTDVTLINGSLRMPLTGSPNFTQPRIVTFQGDFNAMQLSGLSMKELGLFMSGALLNGSAYAHEGFNAVTFDGTNELQVSYSMQVAPK